GGQGNTVTCGANCTREGGAGGGGRVAITGYHALSGGFADDGLYDHIDVSGGDGGTGPAGAGTLFVQSIFDAHGDLIVSNQGKPSPPWYTPLPSVGLGSTHSADPTELVDLNQAWVTNIYKGHTVNPNVNQGNPDTMVDDILVTLVGNTETSLLATGGLDVSAPSDVYRSVHVFDNLEIRDGASVTTDGGDLLIYHGDRASGDDSTLALRGDLDVNRLDLVDSTAVHVTANTSLVFSSLVTGMSATAPLEVTATDCTVVGTDLHTTELYADGATLLVDTLHSTQDVSLVNGSTLTIHETTLHVDGTLLLAGESTIAHPPSTEDEVFDLSIQAFLVTVEPGSQITADGAGFPPGVGAANDTASIATGYSGGSHGGTGGPTTGQQTGTPAIAYGLLYEPVTPGGSAPMGGAGGGVISIEVSGTLAVYGTISADGGAHAQGGGAGGSIDIQANVISGDGWITASGGDADEGHSCGFGCFYSAGGGGGGRIVIEGHVALLDGFAQATLHDHVQAWGGRSGNTTAAGGGAGTIFIQPADAPAGDLIVRNGQAEAPSGSTALITVPSGQFLSVAQGSLEVAGPLIPDRYAGYILNPNIDQGAPGLADDVRVQITGNDQTHLFIAPNIDVTQIAAVGDIYRSAYVFRNIDVGDGASLEAASDVLVLQGDIQSNDTSTLALDGEVIVERLDVSDVTQLTIGGVGLSVQSLVAASTETNPLDSTFDVTVTDAYLSQPNQWASHIDAVDAVLDFGTLLVTEDITLTGATILTISQDEVTVYDTLTLLDTATATHAASTAEAPRRLNLNVGHLSVGPDASVVADGLGYPAGTGPTDLPIGTLAGYPGGSHGGLGGADGDGVGAAPPYGALDAPMYGGAGSPKGGAGGGAIHIAAEQTVTIKGRLSADGESHGLGGGAGGTIFIDSPSMLGDGVVSAVGGDGGVEPCGLGCEITSGSGSGGRIAVVGSSSLSGDFSPSAGYSGIVAHGGDGARPGGAGSIFLRGATQTYGDLLVDNADLETEAGSTPLVTVPTGTIVAIDGAEVTVSEPLAPDRYAGYLVNVGPGTGHAGLLDDPIYTIASNDVVEFTVEETDDLLSVTAPGVAYRAVFVFDNLEIRGGAHLSTDGDIVVLSGDIGSGDTDTFGLNGHLKAHRLDLTSATSLALGAQSDLDVTQVIQGDSVEGAVSYHVNGGTVSQPVLRAASLDATNATFEIGEVIATGDVVLVDTQMSVSDGGINLGPTGGLHLQGHSVLTHPPGEANLARGLSITVMNLIVGEDAAIDVTGKGFPAFTGPAGSAPSVAPAGASHGGAGGVGSLGTSGASGSAADAHGIPTSPRSPGSGGSVPGGGVVQIEVSGVLVLDGLIAADGGSVDTYDEEASAGAGGSIHIKATTISGDGHIRARGGDGAWTYCGNSACFSEGLGGGGGGRIAVTDHVLLAGAFSDPMSALSVRGGNGYQAGGAGTLFLKALNGGDGQLVIDNGGLDDLVLPGHTPLPSVPEGLALMIQGDTLYSFGAFDADTLEGLTVNPNIDQGSANTLSDDALFDVLDNTTDLLTLTPRIEGVALGDVTSVGKTFRGVLVLDAL
ncbi:MAG: hypothetical protein QF464_02050, partial [Myxococcota bacterium]|nr:hypothetical protein [Myxococcota bacterium]